DESEAQGTLSSFCNLQVPACAEEVTIPAEVTLEKVPTHIVDYSEVEQTEEDLKEELHRVRFCAVIRLLVLPLVPIILVANKSDVLDHSSMDIILPLMNQFSNIEVCIECSAKTMKNISEVFHYAQKAVLHPTSPLFTFKDKERLCFNTPLVPKAVDEVKKIVQQNTINGILNKGLTLQGFIYLHTLFAQRGRHETTWTVLRRFGYDDDLELNEAFIPSGCTTELSQSAYLFLRRIFNKHDQDNDKALNTLELQDIFSVFPCPPWDPKCHSMMHTTDNGWITQQGFMAQWTLMAYLDPNRCLKHLMFLGYPLLMEQELSTAIIVTRDKKIDLQKHHSQRNVFMCRVVGCRGAGKSCFLQTFLGRNNSVSRFASKIRRLQVKIHHVLCSCNVCSTLHESEQPNPAEGPCDVACLLYDVNNAQSFRHCANAHKILKRDGVPCHVVACKSDLPELRQDYWSSPAKFCRDHGLPPPVPFSCVCAEASARDVFIQLATSAAYPVVKKGPFQGTSNGLATAAVL
uniref:Ras homolog family member T2 n=1 Tax=Eptatretus burgeri TaxID=7764 RepID=A0A8C4N0M7_EPTBU